MVVPFLHLSIALLVIAQSSGEAQSDAAMLRIFTASSDIHIDVHFRFEYLGYAARAAVVTGTLE
jgi:hypothetical protein